MKDIPEKFEKIMKKKHIYLKTDREREQSPAMSDDLTGYYLRISLLSWKFEKLLEHVKFLISLFFCS